MPRMKKKAKGRPRKKFGHKDEHITLRISAEAKSRLERAAESAELEFADWLRTALDKEARRQLGET